MKLFTWIIGSFITERMPICEEQQGFRKNRSTTDKVNSGQIHWIWQVGIHELHRLDQSVWQSQTQWCHQYMREADIPEETVRIIETLNTNTKTRILVNNTLMYRYFLIQEINDLSLPRHYTLRFAWTSQFGSSKSNAFSYFLKPFAQAKITVQFYHLHVPTGLASVLAHAYLTNLLERVWPALC